MPKLNPKDFFGPITTGATRGNATSTPERFYKFSNDNVTYFDGQMHGEYGKLTNFIAYLPSGIIRESNEEDLYHYTSGHGFKSIISSNELWSSQLGKMNDSSEISYTMEIFVREVFKLLNNKEKVKQLSEKLITLFTKYICKNIYIISFSRRANLLSQWCKYSGIDGVSLGISKKLLLTACAEEHSWQLIEVEYDVEVHVLHLKSLAKRFLDRNILKLSDNELDSWFYESCVDDLQKYAYSIKHPAFYEEEESRLVIDIDPYSDKLKDHPSENRKYIPLHLQDLFKKTDCTDTIFGYMVSGPSINYKAKMKDMYDHLKLNETKFLAILDSGIPYISPKE